MWLEAILTREDLQAVVERFAPLTILLGESGSLLLVAPTDLTLMPDKGIALKCDATLHWPVLGFDVPVSMHGLLLHILPLVEERPDGATLVFRLQIDHTGVAMLPSFFDHGVTAKINQELEQKHVELAWNFVDTLSHVFKLPPSLASASGFALRATAGRVKATETALGLAVEFEASVQPRGVAGGGARDPAKVGGAGDPDAANQAPPAEQPPETRGGEAGATQRQANAPRSRFDPGSLAVGAAAAWLLLASFRAVSGMGARSRRRTGW
jgi:hypothetical protein